MTNPPPDRLGRPAATGETPLLQQLYPRFGWPRISRLASSISDAVFSQACRDLAGRLLPGAMPAWDVSRHPSNSPSLPRRRGQASEPAGYADWASTRPAGSPTHAPTSPKDPSRTSRRRAVSRAGCRRGSLGRRV